MNHKSILSTAITASLILTAGAVQAATTHTLTDGRFDWKDASGTVTADGHNDVQGAFDMQNGTGTFDTSTPLIGSTWHADIVEMNMHSSLTVGTSTALEAHSFDFNIREFLTGSSGVVSCLSASSAGYDGCAQYAGDILYEGVIGGIYNTIAYNLAPGQFAMHSLFDWSDIEDMPVLSIFQLTSNDFGNLENPLFPVASVDLNGNISGNPFGTNPAGGSINDGSLYGVAMPDCAGCGPFPNQTLIINSASPVPIPSAVWLFGSGLIGLIGVARRKKS